MHEETARRVVGLVLRAGLAAPLSDAQLLQEFIRARSSEAFAEIVRRHGSMVLGVCRRVLAHDQDAEDAFQATFIVLARKAARIRPPDALGRWLYGVAFRTAQKAKSLRQRDQTRRSEWVATLDPRPPSPSEPVDWLPLLDRELNRLSERDRMPIVLCDLMGRSRKEAADELGVSEGTLSSRLARARDRLRRQLAKRGVIPSIAVGTFAGQIYAVPMQLTESVASFTKVAISPFANQLVQGVLRTMFIQSTTKSVAMLICFTVISALGFCLSFPSRAQPLPPKSATVAEEKNDHKPSSDEEHLQGAWRVKESFLGGVLLKEQIGRRYVIREDHFSYLSMYFTLDPTQTPKTWDFTLLTEGVNRKKGNVLAGIYALKGDILRICWNTAPNLDRPKELKATSTNNFLVMERMKIDEVGVANKGNEKSNLPEGKLGIQNLREELVVTLSDQLAVLEARTGRGKNEDLYRYLEISEQLMRAELDLCSVKKQRLIAINRNLKRLKILDDFADLKWQIGQMGRDDLLHFKAARLRVEILLETEKDK